ncbi:hypothetical protein M407DRAFT_180921 [Tulasnella calospora MUT 4182]|uniref:COPI associated n=1 Tax=Tulasnella calospora MUT 4182 TaxID=1051891 RepID=A0A0C3L3X2_9AGAM|nr:hypothetical protein M407DRAFT_180921 [Tulasnella calospora MUT 4182]
MDQFNNILGNFAVVFKCANIIVGALMMTGAIFAITVESISSIISGVYTGVFAAIVIGLELYPLKSKQKKFLYRYAGFIYSLPGRGLFYILVGLLMGGYYPVQHILGAVVAVVGLAYIVLEIIDKPDLPPSMIPPYPDTGDLQESLPIFHTSREE